MLLSHLGWFQCFLGGVEGVEAFGLGGLKQLWRGGDEDDFRALEHIARGDGGGQLQSVRPTQGGAVEQLARGLKYGWVKRLLHHARGFKPKNFKRGSCAFC